MITAVGRTLTFFSSLFSFAKYLEVLVYSPAICTLTPTLCEHTTPPAAAPTAGPDPPPLPASRLNIVRHFSAHGHTASFTLSAIDDDIFELRVPRLQITRKSGDKGGARASVASSTSTEDGSVKSGNTPVDEEKRTLRREIKAWWEGVADHMDKLVRCLHDVA